MASACCSSWAGATTNWPNRRCATRPCPKPISRTCWHCASPPCAKAWSGWAVSTPSARAAGCAPPSARNTPGQSSWKENASASRCARTATACAWTTCTCTRRPRPGLGGRTLRRLLAQADAQGLPLRVGALRGSDSNRFYQRHGFVQIEESEWDIEYLRPAQAKTGANASVRRRLCRHAMPPRPPPRTEQSRARGRSNEDQRHNPTRPPNRGRADPAPPVRSRRPWGSAQRFGDLYVLGSVTPRWP